MDKAQLRQLGVTNLKKLAEHKRKKQQKEAVILNLFFSSRLWKEAQIIGLTRSTSFEFNTEPIINRALAEGKIVAVPKSLPEHQLVFFEVDANTTYQTTAFGVEEPVSQLQVLKETIDLLLVPGVVFAKNGYRIGFGGGYYDRYLTDYQGKTCSLVFSEQLNSDWTPDHFDQPIARIYTDSAKGVNSYE